jgi:hypothetical protein
MFRELAETWAKLAAENEADEPLLGALSEIDQGEPYEALPRALKLRWEKHSEKESSDVESHENPGARMDPRRSESA